jgi:hypothetical protein
MILIKNDRQKYYTLDDNGFLSKIDSLANRETWFEKIGNIEEKLQTAQSNGDILFLYRGESRETFGRKTGIISNFNEDPNFDKFFVIGSKAKSYYKDKRRNILAIRQFNHKEKRQYIVDSLNKLSQLPKYRQVLKYFNCIQNNNDFIKIITSIKDKDDLLTIENFYLAFIHTISSEPMEIQAYSVLLSSTKDMNATKDFSKQGFIIAFWLRIPISLQAIDYNNIAEYCLLIKKYSLPVVDYINFVNESEVTLFSAIFPHNIFYVYDEINDKLIFNPYIINTNLDSVLDGFNVNQKYFNNNIKGIYDKSIWRRGVKLVYEN